MTTRSLATRYGIANPLDRMALTANGNLQRLVASYYDAPVTVVVQSCRLRESPPPPPYRGAPASAPHVWDRAVHLQVLGATFCTAHSVIAVHDAQCRHLVAAKRVGLGQLFRYLDLLPEFVLHGAGPQDDDGGGDGGFWRDYTLQCAELTCRIHEDFAPGMWEYSAPLPYE